MGWRLRSRKKIIDNQVVTCDGNCFNVTVRSQAESVEHFHAPHPPPTLQERKDLAAKVYTTPLKAWQTRLIKIHNGNFEEQLVVDCEVVNLFGNDGAVLLDGTQIVQYYALSYAWGSDDELVPINYNGIEYFTSPNLTSALKALRALRPGAFFWVDVLCINQFDSNEKSRQVREMLNIYQKADGVLVWLGNNDVHSDVVAAHTQRLDARRTELDRSMHQSACIDRLKNAYVSFQDFYRRPWLQRTWIRQEVYAARQIVVLCGSFEIRWENFIAGGLLLQKMHKILSDWQRLPQGQVHDEHIRIRLVELSDSVRTDLQLRKLPRDLLDILLVSPSFEAGCRKDFVYGVLGMAGIPCDTTDRPLVETSHKIRIDYGKTDSQVFQDLVRYFLDRERVTGLAKMLHYYVRREALVPGLPSWAMDWKASTCSKGDIDHIRRLQGLPRVPSYGAEDVTKLSPAFFPFAKTWSIKFSDRRWLDKSQGDLEHEYDRLRVSGRILNMIVEMTDLTCDIGSFCADTGTARDLRIGSDDLREGGSLEDAADRIHRRAVADLSLPSSSSPPEKASIVRFDPDKHHRRLAILAVPCRRHVALVPSTSRPGDFVVGLDSEVLPIVVSPVPGIPIRDAGLDEEIVRQFVRSQRLADVVPLKVGRATKIVDTCLTVAAWTVGIAVGVILCFCWESLRQVSHEIDSVKHKKQALRHRSLVHSLYRYKDRLNSMFEFRGVAFIELMDYEFNTEDEFWKRGYSRHTVSESTSEEEFGLYGSDPWSRRDGRWAPPLTEVCLV